MTEVLQQFAALPVMMTVGKPHVLLVTSRTTQRWIIPKGHPEKGMKPHTVAKLEALEEAGVIGTIGEVPLGFYQSTKCLGSGVMVPCDVTVFQLDVSSHLSAWKEDCQRKRMWVPLSQAARFANDGGLGAFLDHLVA
jgi:8-oxo-dGTP pyrophosphatase MutT (NUDIX family)